MSIEPVTDNPIVRRRRIDSPAGPSIPTILTVPDLRIPSAAAVNHDDRNAITSNHSSLTEQLEPATEGVHKSAAAAEPSPSRDGPLSRTIGSLHGFSENAQKNLRSAGAVAAAVVACAMIATAMQESSTEGLAAPPESPLPIPATPEAPKPTEIVEVPAQAAGDLFPADSSWDSFSLDESGSNAGLTQAERTNRDLADGRGGLGDEPSLAPSLTPPIPPVGQDPYPTTTLGPSSAQATRFDSGRAQLNDRHAENAAGRLFPPLPAEDEIDAIPSDTPPGAFDVPTTSWSRRNSASSDVQPGLSISHAEEDYFVDHRAQATPPVRTHESWPTPTTETVPQRTDANPAVQAPVGAGQLQYPSTARSLYPSLREVQRQLQQKLDERRRMRVSQRTAYLPSFPKHPRGRGSAGHASLSNDGAFR